MSHEDEKEKAAEFMVAARHAAMFLDVRELISTLTDPEAKCPGRHIEARRVLPLLDAFLGEGYTGRMVTFKRGSAMSEREQFEAFAKEKFNITPLVGDGAFFYDKERTQAAWDAWQARAALSQPVKQTRSLTEQQHEAIEYGADCIHEKWGETMKVETVLRSLLTAAHPESGDPK